MVALFFLSLSLLAAIVCVAICLIFKTDPVTAGAMSLSDRLCQLTFYSALGFLLVGRVADLLAGQS